MSSRNVRGSLVALILLLTVFARADARAAGFVDPAFQQVWERADRPLAEHQVARSWLWGEAPFAGSYEAYADAPGGQRLVQYFDKARMEINQPNAAPGPFYVTNGLLVVEMLSGRLQTGNASFGSYAPASSAVAGDTLSANPGAPTYASFARVATLMGTENAATDATGAAVDGQISGDGTVSKGAAGGVTYAHYAAETRHNIPNVFWRFMNASGRVYDAASKSYSEALVFDWLAAMGYPISEPYWATVQIAGQEQHVLIQMFQRRVLTYNPRNAPAWQVEMGNVGRHYADWRTSLGLPIASGGGPVATPSPGGGVVPTPSPGGGSASLHDLGLKVDKTMNALTALKAHSVNSGTQNGTTITDIADYQWAAPGQYYVKVTSPRSGVTPDAVAEQIRIGNKLYGRTNNAAAWDQVTTTDTYQWPAYNYTYLFDHGDEVIREPQAMVNGTPCQVVRVLIKNNSGIADRYIHTYIGLSDNLIHREVTEGLVTADHPAGLSTTDFFDFNVPNTITAPANVKP